MENDFKASSTRERALQNTRMRVGIALGSRSDGIRGQPSSASPTSNEPCTGQPIEKQPTTRSSTAKAFASEYPTAEQVSTDNPLAENPSAGNHTAASMESPVEASLFVEASTSTPSSTGSHSVTLPSAGSHSTESHSTSLPAGFDPRSPRDRDFEDSVLREHLSRLPECPYKVHCVIACLMLLLLGWHKLSTYTPTYHRLSGINDTTHIDSLLSSLSDYPSTFNSFPFRASYIINETMFPLSISIVVMGFDKIPAGSESDKWISAIILDLEAIRDTTPLIVPKLKESLAKTASLATELRLGRRETNFMSNLALIVPWTRNDEAVQLAATCRKIEEMGKVFQEIGTGLSRFDDIVSENIERDLDGLRVAKKEYDLAWRKSCIDTREEWCDVGDAGELIESVESLVKDLYMVLQPLILHSYGVMMYFEFTSEEVRKSVDKKESVFKKMTRRREGDCIGALEERLGDWGSKMSKSMEKAKRSLEQKEDEESAWAYTPRWGKGKEVVIW